MDLQQRPRRTTLHVIKVAQQPYEGYTPSGRQDYEGSALNTVIQMGLPLALMGGGLLAGGAVKGLKGINPYQGEFYGLYQMFETCEAALIPIVQWTTHVDDVCRERIKTGFSRIIQAKDFDHARSIKDQLYRTGHADPLGIFTR